MRDGQVLLKSLKPVSGPATAMEYSSSGLDAANTGRLLFVNVERELLVKGEENGCYSETFARHGSVRAGVESVRVWKSRRPSSSTRVLAYTPTHILAVESLSISD